MAEILKIAQHTESGKLSSHREISIRYRAHRRNFVGFRSKPSLPSIRVAELDRLFTNRWGKVLPPDDAGRDDAEIMAHHLASISPRKATDLIIGWLTYRCPWMGEKEAADLIEVTLRFPARWTAAELGGRLNLNDCDRRRLRITTIRSTGTTTRQLKANRRARQAEAKCIQRRAQGSVPRNQYERWSLSQIQPWKAMGISRRTWERRRKKVTIDASLAKAKDTTTASEPLATVPDKGNATYVEKREDCSRQRHPVFSVQQANPDTRTRRHNGKGTGKAILLPSLVHVPKPRLPDNDNRNRGLQGISETGPSINPDWTCRAATSGRGENANHSRFLCGMAQWEVERK